MEAFNEHFLDIYAYLSISKIIVGDLNHFWNMNVQDTFYLVQLQQERDKEMEKQIKDAENGTNRRFSEPLYENDMEAVNERESRFRD